jgi:hypothetical protein
MMDSGAHLAEYGRLVSYSRTLDDSEYVGAIVRWPVADGHAAYLVTSMEGSGTLQHIPFAHAYTVDPAMIRGLRKADIKANVDRQRSFDRVFRRVP